MIYWVLSEWYIRMGGIWCDSVVIIVFGVIIVGLRDFLFELGGYVLVFLFNLIIVIYFVIIVCFGMWCKFFVVLFWV